MPFNVSAGLGGLLGGFSQGMRANQDYELKKQALDIQKQHVTAQQKLLEAEAALKNNQAQEALRQTGLQNTLDQAINGPAPDVGQQSSQYGQEGGAGPFKPPEIANPEIQQIRGQKIRSALMGLDPKSFAHAEANQVDPMESVKRAVMTMYGLSHPEAFGLPGQGGGQPQQTPVGMPQQSQPMKALDANTAASIFNEAGRDPNKARDLARSRGFDIGGGQPTAQPAAVAAPTGGMNTGRFLPSLNSKGEVSFRMQGEPNSAPNKLFQAWNAQNPGASQEQQQKAYQDILSGAAGARTSGAASAKLDLPMAPGQESTMAKVGTAGNVELAPMGLSPNQASAQGYRKVETKVLDSARALAPAKQAMADLEQPLVKLAKENQSFMGRASNIAGSRGDFLGMNMGGIAQDLGASHAGDDVKGGWLNFMQHYESVVGGLRGASSPQLQSIMEARGPQPGMNAHQIAQRVTYLKNIVKAMEGEIKNTVSGGRYGGALDKAAISNPNDMKPDAGFLKAVAGK